jgi:hypothetical protein
MKKNLLDRLTAAERRLMPPISSIQEIIIGGGLAPGVALISTVGGRRFKGQPGETLETFRARVVAAAHTAGERFVVIGGFPDDDDLTDFEWVQDGPSVPDFESPEERSLPPEPHDPP